MVLAALVAGAMCALAFFALPPLNPEPATGLCFPGPSGWGLAPLWSWIANCALLAAIAIGGAALNGRYNFIKTPQPIVPALFLVLAASDPYAVQSLSVSALVCLVNVVCLWILFGCHRAGNATQQLFVIGTFLSAGSMVSGAFLVFPAAYACAAAVMKALRLKEILALGMGLVAPWWIALGFGVIAPESIRLPELSFPFGGAALPPATAAVAGGLGGMVFFGLVLGLNNSMKLYAGNSRVNALNLAVNLVGLAAVAGVAVDFNHFTAYADTICLVFAVQIANLCSLWSFRREWLLSAVPAAVYVLLFTVAAVGTS